ncbi:uncharacterized, partial [Tachysurus ichikawai]
DQSFSSRALDTETEEDGFRSVASKSF